MLTSLTCPGSEYPPVIICALAFFPSPLELMGAREIRISIPCSLFSWRETQRRHNITQAYLTAFNSPDLNINLHKSHSGGVHLCALWTGEHFVLLCEQLTLETNHTLQPFDPAPTPV